MGEVHSLRYGNYIGDGNSKRFAKILNLNLYTVDHRDVKSECMGHVEKRMGTRL